MMLYSFFSWDRIVKQICFEVETSLQQQTFLNNFRMSGLPSLSERLEKFLKLLVTFYVMHYADIPAMKYYTWLGDATCPLTTF